MIGPMRLAALLLVLAIAAPAAAQDYDREISPDSVVVDPAAHHAKVRKGRQLVSGQAALDQPIVDAGRVIDRVDVMQEWDCHAARYRNVRKTFRDVDGAYVHSEPRDGPWTDVRKDGPGWEMLKKVCPPPQPDADPTAAGDAGPQVVTMPPSNRRASRSQARP